LERKIQLMVGVLAALLLALGLNFLFNPEGGGAQFGLVADGVRGLNSLRGDLGGMFLGSGILLVMGLVRAQPVYFLAVAVVIAAIAFGRLVGLLLDGLAGNSTPEFVVELVMVAVLLYAWRRAQAPR